MQMKEYDLSANPNLSTEVKKEIMVVNISRYDRIREHQPELINFLSSRRWNTETAYTNRDYSQEYGFTELCFVSDDYLI